MTFLDDSQLFKVLCSPHMLSFCRQNIDTFLKLTLEIFFFTLCHIQILQNKFCYEQYY